MGWTELFNEANSVGFMLLYFRFAALFMAVPIFSHQNIPMTHKAAMAFFFTVVFYPAMPPVQIDINTTAVLLAVLGEFFSVWRSGSCFLWRLMLSPLQGDRYRL